MRTLALAVLLAAPASAAATRIAECGDLEFVAAHATLIVRGEVTSVLAKKDKAGAIHSFIRVKVEAVHKGKLLGRNVTIKQNGGVVDGVAIADSETPSFKPGDKGWFYLDHPATAFYAPRYHDTICGWGASEHAPPEAAR